jgi:hypothetical protein
MEICGLQVDVEQEKGPFCKVAWISGFQIYFPTENLVVRDHCAWTGQDGSGARWIEVARTRGHGGALTSDGC